MAFPKTLLVSLHLLVLCVTVFATEFQLLNSPNSLLELAPAPAQAPKHHHHHHPNHPKTAQPPIIPPHFTPVPDRSQPPVKSHSPVKAPAKAPVKSQPPSKAPVKPLPPSKAPSPAPSHVLPKRSLVAVEGVVYCKPCKFSGVDTLLNSTPIVGANVELHCNNTKYPTTQLAKTDKDGYFFMLASNKVTTYGSHKCKVILRSSNNPKCNKPTDLHYGLQGSILIPKVQSDQPKKPLPYQLFTVGPFAYEPPKKCAH